MFEFDGILLKPCLLQPCFHVAGKTIVDKHDSCNEYEYDNDHTTNTNTKHTIVTMSYLRLRANTLITCMCSNNHKIHSLIKLA